MQNAPKQRIADEQNLSSRGENGGQALINKHINWRAICHQITGSLMALVGPISPCKYLSIRVNDASLRGIPNKLPWL